MLERIRLKNLLSFGPDSEEFELRPLNVLIGTNGSGKSNFIEAVGLLQAAPSELGSPIQAGRGVGDWIWQGDPKANSARHSFALLGQIDAAKVVDASPHARRLVETLADELRK